MGLVSKTEKGRLNDKELEQLYEKQWRGWMTDFKSSSQINQSQPNIEVSLESSLKDLLKTHQN